MQSSSNNRKWILWKRPTLDTIGKHASFISNDESQIVTEKSHFVTFQSNKGIVGGIYDRPIMEAQNLTDIVGGI